MKDIINSSRAKNSKIEKGTIIEDRIDEPDLYAVLYKNTDEHGQPVTLKGDDVLTHPNIVALARIQNPVHDFNTWTRFDIPFEYSGNVDEKLLKAYGYNLAVVFTSSIRRSQFLRRRWKHAAGR